MNKDLYLNPDPEVVHRVESLDAPETKSIKKKSKSKTDLCRLAGNLLFKWIGPETWTYFTSLLISEAVNKDKCTMLKQADQDRLCDLMSLLLVPAPLRQKQA